MADDDSEVTVLQPHTGDDAVQGNHQHDRRDAVGRQDAHHNGLPPGVLEAHQRVSGKGAEYHVDNHGDAGDQKAVQEIPDNLAVSEGIPIPHETPALWQNGRRHFEQLRGGLEGTQRHPRQGQADNHNHKDHDNDQADFFQQPAGFHRMEIKFTGMRLHGSSPFCVSLRQRRTSSRKSPQTRTSARRGRPQRRKRRRCWDCRRSSGRS